MKQWWHRCYDPRIIVVVSTLLIILLRSITGSTSLYQALYQGLGIYLCMSATLTIVPISSMFRHTDEQCPGYHNPFVTLMLGMAYLLSYHPKVLLLITSMLYGFNLLCLGYDYLQGRSATSACLIDDSIVIIASSLLFIFS